MDNILTLIFIASLFLTIGFFVGVGLVTVFFGKRKFKMVEPNGWVASFKNLLAERNKQGFRRIIDENIILEKQSSVEKHSFMFVDLYMTIIVDILNKFKEARTSNDMNDSFESLTELESLLIEGMEISLEESTKAENLTDDKRKPFEEMIEILKGQFAICIYIITIKKYAIFDYLYQTNVSKAVQGKSPYTEEMEGKVISTD